MHVYKIIVENQCVAYYASEDLLIKRDIDAIKKSFAALNKGAHLRVNNINIEKEDT